MLLSTQQVAEKLHVNAATIVKWCRIGVLPAVNVGTKTRAFWKVDDVALKEWRRNQSAVPASNANAAPPVAKPAPEKLAAPNGMVSLQDAAKSAGIHYTTVSDWWKAGKLTGQKVRSRVFVDSASLHAYLQQRAKAATQDTAALLQDVAAAHPEMADAANGNGKSLTVAAAAPMLAPMADRLKRIEDKLEHLLTVCGKTALDCAQLKAVWGVPEAGQ